MNYILFSAQNNCGGEHMNGQWRPGEKAPQSGNYACYDSQGRCGGSAYLEKGQRFPATQHSGSYYVMED